MCRRSGRLLCWCGLCAALPCQVTVAFVGSIGVLAAVVLLAFRSSWGRAFTTTDDIVEMMASLIPFLAAFVIGDSLGASSLAGILRGAGVAGLAWLGCLLALGWGGNALLLSACLVQLLQQIKWVRLPYRRFAIGTQALCTGLQSSTLPLSMHSAFRWESVSEPSPSPLRTARCVGPTSQVSSAVLRTLLTRQSRLRPLAAHTVLPQGSRSAARSGGCTDSTRAWSRPCGP